MKIKTTKQFIKLHCQKAFAIGYCDLQYLLQYKNAFAYSAGGVMVGLVTTMIWARGSSFQLVIAR